MTVIAEQLRVSVPSVTTYRACAMAKLHLRTRVDSVEYALAQGWRDAEADSASASPAPATAPIGGE